MTSDDLKPSSSERPVRRYGRPKNMVCDGTVADYRRHYRHRERPCAKSREAWRNYYRVEEQKKRAKKRLPHNQRYKKPPEVVYPEGYEGNALYRLGILKHLKEPHGNDQSREVPLPE